MTDRRALLRHVLASPLAFGLIGADPALAGREDLLESAITRAADALDVFDLEAVARRTIPPAHWGYLSTGVDGEETIRANREAFSRYQLRTKRFVDVSRIDMGVELFGVRYNSPVFMCPLGGQRAFQGEGEVAVARAAKARNQLQILSTVSSSPVEAVVAARGAPVWFQLYTTGDFATATRLVKRAEAAGCPVVAVTVDLPAGRNTETVVRLSRTDTRPCTSCHEATGSSAFRRPMFQDAPVAGSPGAAPGKGLSSPLLTSPSLTWDYIKRLKDVTRMKVLIKGLETAEDAALALEHGADGIMVSNHGGRATETGRGTLECLPEVVAEVRGRVPVFVDGGVRRGTDVLKALSLGATAVGVGRPYVWGLGAFGQEGVERVLQILNTELFLAMAGVGARSIREITNRAVVRRA